jgi:putative ABC transport system ATP-binding protein
MSEQKRDLAVRAEGLNKKYAAGRTRVAAITDVSLAIPAGEFWVVRGPSGSGKTTLLGLLGGMIAPTSGEVHLAGESLTHLRDHHRADARRKLVGMVFQELALIQGMTVEENALLPFLPAGGASKEDRQRVAGLLDRFGIDDLADARVERLSGGERQRAAMARALAFDPPVLLLDEPTAYVDAENVRAIMEHLVGLRDEGKTILAATHDVRLADDERLDRTIELADGRARI